MEFVQDAILFTAGPSQGMLEGEGWKATICADFIRHIMLHYCSLLGRCVRNALVLKPGGFEDLRFPFELALQKTFTNVKRLYKGF